MQIDDALLMRLRRMALNFSRNVEHASDLEAELADLAGSIIAAERERCAKIVQGEATCPPDGCKEIGWPCRVKLAEAIRSQDR